MCQLVAATTVTTTVATVTTAETTTATAAAFATTVTAATTATALTTAAETTTAARRTFFTRTGDVDSQIATIDILAVQGLDSGFSRFRGFHGDEGKTTRTTRELVHHQVDLDDPAVSGEKVVQVVFDRVEGKISYEQLSTH